MARLALGIESTAHTFGVGIMDFEGKVLSLIYSFQKVVVFTQFR